MLKNNSLVFATQNMCEICSEAITNPLCPICLTREIDAWSTLYPNLRKELLPKLRKKIQEIENNMRTSRCIKCQDKRASICPYCFTEHVLKELKKVGANKIILKEFLEFFNFNNEPPNPHKEKWGYI